MAKKFIMSSQRKFLLAFIFLILRKHHLALGTYLCLDTNGNYTSNSTYKANLNTVLSYMSTNVNSSSGFYSASAGKTPDAVNAIVLCRSDIQLSTCRECIKNTTEELLQSCPNQKQAISWFELCMLRYSDETIFGTLGNGLNYYFWWITHQANVTSPVKYKESLRTLLDSLRNQAANYGGSLRKIAVGNATAPDFQVIFALVQCTPDLSPEDCNNCLLSAAGDLPGCCDGVKGSIVGRPSCIIRYETNYHFYNETRLQELEFVPKSPILSPPPPPPPPPPTPPPPTPPPPPGTTTRTIIIGVGSVVAFGAFVLILYCFRKKISCFCLRQKPKEEFLKEIGTAESLDYDFSTIKAATNDFSDNNKLGQGGFGAVYKGKLPNDQEIAVKRLSRNSGQGDVEFKNEVVLLAKLQHRNLVRLLGFSIQGTEKLIVYEFVQNGSLYLCMSDPVKRSYLDWDRRYKIIGGIARGLLYLHEDSRLRIIHRDLKASNVLLDEEMNPKIADFGMARLFGQDETQGNTSKIVGTYGYMSPEQARLSLRDMMKCIHIGLLCVQENAANRPTMAAILVMVSSSTMILPVPSEPAFFMASRFGPDTSLFHNNYNDSNSSDAASKGWKTRTAISEGLSINDVTVTELDPR